MNKKGQISIEYLIVVGFIVFVVISILGLATYNASSSRDSIRSSQISSYAGKIISSSESVFYAGTPSKVTINAYLPAGVNEVQILENGLMFNYSSSSGTNIVTYTGNVNLTGSLSNSEGTKRIVVAAQVGDVRITEE